MLEEAVRIIMTGICTFIGADVGDNNRPMTAVFANARHHFPEHHVSMLIPEDEYIVETDVYLESLTNELGQRYHAIVLDGRSITLAGVTATEFELAEPVLSERALEEKRPTTLQELESVRWIPSLGRSWPRFFPLRAARRMREGFLSKAADSQLVGASFELPNGRLASNWVSGDVWEFSPRSWTRRRYRTAIAQEVKLDTRVSGNVVHFDLCELRTQSHCGYVRIHRRDPQKHTEPIQIVLANVPDEDRLPNSITFCGECGTSECKASNDPFPCTCVDHHYANYYDALSSKKPKKPSLPRRVRRDPPLRPVAMRVGGGNCAPTTYP